jgi:hypothetical protein
MVRGVGLFLFLVFLLTTVVAFVQGPLILNLGGLIGYIFTVCFGALITWFFSFVAFGRWWKGSSSKKKKGH